jgi:alginate O-acetyltransferase complex protein AlgI
VLFHSFPFLFLFLPLTLVAYWFVPRREHKHWILFLSSYAFYAYWDFRFCALLLFSSVVDYVSGIRIADAESPKMRLRWLWVSLVANLGTLGFFKYWDFFAASLNSILYGVGIEASAPLLDLILPLGISFYTFQSMSYSIDIYREQAEPTRSPIKFLAFVSMFPQLLAGPIVRWVECSKQLDKLPRRPQMSYMAMGAAVFIVGLAKKVLIADNLYPYIDARLFPSMSVLEFWPAFVGWTFWLYYDFSSYSDMAVGLGLMLGLRLPWNFDSPFKADSLANFWRRWHMTLGRWMRDYLYFSLGIRSHLQVLVGTFAVFVIIGFWHGASWNMIGWGAYMGIGMVVEQLARRSKFSIKPRFLRQILVLLFWINGGWFFRAESLQETGGFLTAAFGGNGVGAPHWITLGAVTLAAVHLFAFPNISKWRWRLAWWEGVGLAAMLFASLQMLFTERPFFYFQF